MKALARFLSRNRYKVAGVGVAALSVGSARADVAAIDTTAFDSAVSTFTVHLTTLVGVMAPAIVTIASITLIIVAINWLVRKVRGAIGRG